MSLVASHWATSQQPKQKRSPIELRFRSFRYRPKLLAVVMSPPLANGHGRACWLARLRRFRVKQLVNLFQNPPPQLEQFFPDAALVFRHDANLSRDR